jgi:hypothetical protein
MEGFCRPWSQPGWARATAAASVVVFAGLALKAAAALAADPNFTCPPAPPAWTSSPRPQFWGPAEDPGDDTERITCSYANSRGLSTSVVVSYALPSDINPINDFYYGCGTGSVPWSTAQRTYDIASGDHWALANFEDPYHAVSGSDQGKFETLARQMLSEAQPLAHACGAKTVPTQVLASWLFDFAFRLTGDGVTGSGRVGTHPSQAGAGIGSYAIPDGTFKTTGLLAHAAVADLAAPLLRIAVVEHGRRHTVTIKLGTGVSFRFEKVTGGSGAASLVTRVRVIRSTLSTCHAGSHGTLRLGTSPSRVRLSLCGSVFGGLKIRQPQVQIVSG